MQGRRIDNQANNLVEVGDYWYSSANGYWMGRVPSGDYCNLKNHTVVEHEDGTITVSPSILVHHGQGEVWHGYLERGVWREV
jgi:hypothetical protein